MKIYLAGPIQHAPDDGRAWRESIKNQWEDAAEWIDPGAAIPADEARSMEPEKLIRKDKALIDGCDALLVGLTAHRSVGTWREVEYAIQNEIPVAIWMVPSNFGNDAEARKHDLSPWIKEAGHVSTSFTACMAYFEVGIDE